MADEPDRLLIYLGVSLSPKGRGLRVSVGFCDVSKNMLHVLGEHVYDMSTELPGTVLIGPLEDFDIGLFMMRDDWGPDERISLAEPPLPFDGEAN